MKQPSISLLTDGIAPFVTGGMQDHSRNLLEYFASNGWTVYLFHTAFQEEEKAKALDGISDAARKNIRSFFVPFPEKGVIPGHYVRNSKKYARALFSKYQEASIQCDFIFAQGFCGYEFVMQKRKGFPLPPIGVHLHGLNMLQNNYGWRSKWNAMLLRPIAISCLLNADHVFSLGGELTHVLSRNGVDPSRIIQIPGAVSENWLRVEKSEHSAFRFLFVGRYDRVKGAELLFRAWKQVKKEGVELHYVGPIPSEIRSQHPDISFYGEIRDTASLQKIMASCDVLVCPSLTEGMPVVVMEAMAVGLPVIASNVGATSELVQADNGILISANNQDELVAAMNQMLRFTSAIREQFAAVAKNRISARHTWQKVGEQTANAIRRICI